MFLGTTPTWLRPFVYREIREQSPKRVIVPFAGNFVIESLAASASPESAVVSTDVSLYSRAIGFYLVNEPFEARLNERALEYFPYFRGKESPLEKAVQALFLADVAEAVEKGDHVRYYARLLMDAQARTELYAEKCQRNLEKFKESCPKGMSFLGTDAFPLLQKCGVGDLVYYDPPFWTGGYEKMFKAMEALWSFEAVPYTEFTDELKLSMLAELRIRGAKVYWRTLNPLAEIPQGFREVFRYEYRPRTSCCVYASEDRSPVVGYSSQLSEEVVNYPILQDRDEITVKSRIQTVKVRNAVANHYRIMWVKGVDMTESEYAYLFFVDGKLFGVATLISGQTFGVPLALLNSDPVTPTSRYRHLSKLLLHVVCSRPFLEEVNDATMWEHTGFTTAVFTDREVSMKYRGLFELAQKKKDPSNQKRNVLYYHSKKQFRSYKEAMIEWVKKESNVLIPNSLGAEAQE